MRRLLQRKWLCVGLILSLVLLLVLWRLSPYAFVSVLAPCRLPETTIVIDPGHGGEDGGAVSASGQKESSINLAIGHKLDALLHFYGLRTVMTREEDISIHDANSKTIREKKGSDIRKRVALTERTTGALLISIHQNAYPNSKYAGMQIFYANEASRSLSFRMQEMARRFLDEKNTRQPLQIQKSVYLMNHITCPAVLVECGFLSNEQEAVLLQKNAYQTKIAITIAAACLSESIP